MKAHHKDVALLLPEHVTLDWLAAQCSEEAECWIWNGRTTSNGYPLVFVGGADVSVRRVAAALAGKAFAPRQPITTTCRCRECVRPDHMRPSSAQAIGARVAREGGWRSVARAARISAARLSTTVISDEAVRAVRLAPRGQVATVAAALGVNYHTAKAIRTGRIRKDYSSPWAGMGAR